MEDKLSLAGDILLNGVTQEQVRDYKKIEMPVATFGKCSKHDSSSPVVFGSPAGLTIEMVKVILVYNPLYYLLLSCIIIIRDYIIYNNA